MTKKSFSTREKFKRNWKLKSKKFKFGFMLLFVLLFCGMGSAVWILNHDATSGMTISSAGTIEFTNDFSISEVNATHSSYGKIETITVKNNNGVARLFEISVEEVLEDVDTDLCDSSGDVTYALKDLSVGPNVDYFDGGNITVDGSDEFDLSLITNASLYSCPQNYSITVTLSEM